MAYVVLEEDPIDGTATVHAVYDNYSAAHAACKAGDEVGLWRWCIRVDIESEHNPNDDESVNRKLAEEQEEVD